MGSLPHIVEDCNGVLQLFSDGSVFRSDAIKFRTSVLDDTSVLYKDRVFDKFHGLSLRIYKPAAKPASSVNLPVLFFFHGGGFCVGSRTWPNCHNSCLRLCSGLQAIVIAPDYRLAPEHRLPAAIDDGVTAVRWLQLQAMDENCDEWLRNGVDFERVFVVGDSSGGNIAHHLAVRLGPGSTEMTPVKVRGYVLMAPFFGGTERTKSEAVGPPEELLNMDILDRFWRLSLPVGENADHPYANPFGPASRDLEPVNLDPILVIVGGSEILKDRVEEYAKSLKVMGKKMDYAEFEGKQHGFFINEPYSDIANKVLHIIRNFILVKSY